MQSSKICTPDDAVQSGLCKSNSNWLTSRPEQGKKRQRSSPGTGEVEKKTPKTKKLRQWVQWTLFIVFNDCFNFSSLYVRTSLCSCLMDQQQHKSVQGWTLLCYPINHHRDTFKDSMTIKRFKNINIKYKTVTRCNIEKKRLKNNCKDHRMTNGQQRLKETVNANANANMFSNKDTRQLVFLASGPSWTKWGLAWPRPACSGPLGGFHTAGPLETSVNCNFHHFPHK